MAVSQSFLAFVLEQLEDVRAVSPKRMFGGVGLYSEETFFAVLDNDTLFFKVDAATVARYVERRMPPFQPMPDKPPMTGYYQVPVDVVEDRDALAEWASAAVAVGRRAPGAGTRRSPRKTRRTRAEPAARRRTKAAPRPAGRTAGRAGGRGRPRRRRSRR